MPAFERKDGLPFFGDGLGIGTNVGAMLYSGKQQFLGGEGEWGRIIVEIGAFFGLTVIFVRVSFVFQMAKNAYFKLAKGDLLPWLLLSFGFITVSQGLWAQPTSLGFSTVIGGLMLASLNDQKKDQVKPSLKVVN